MANEPWIGVDFDGTLAIDGTVQPVMKMVGRVRQWLKEGRRVKIFTARASGPLEAVRGVESFCQFYFGVKLPVTNVKDYLMEEYWDDRAVQVFHNTGNRADGKP